LVLDVGRSCNWETPTGEKYVGIGFVNSCLGASRPRHFSAIVYVRPGVFDADVVYPGGTPDSQREFLETLSSDPSDPRLAREWQKGSTTSIANQFALGYTYQDVLDADREGTI
jgi:hypothetical protein